MRLPLFSRYATQLLLMPVSVGKPNPNWVTSGWAIEPSSITLSPHPGRFYQEVNHGSNIMYAANTPIHKALWCIDRILKSCTRRKIPLDWRLVVGSGRVVLMPFLISRVTKRRECAMPIELLVPITIFVLGIVVSVSLSSIGIERIVEGNKK